MKNEFKLTIRAISENERFARTVCAAFVLPLDPTVEEIEEIKTAISEAVTNCIIHAYHASDGEIIIEGSMINREITYKITDFGCGIIDVKKAMEPMYSGSDDDERSGMGFSIMEAFMDELSVSSDVNGTTVCMKKKV